jgi:uncharacterized protein YceK
MMKLKAFFLVLAAMVAVLMVGCGDKVVADESGKGPAEAERKVDAQSGNEQVGAAATSSE